MHTKWIHTIVFDVTHVLLIVIISSVGAFSQQNKISFSGKAVDKPSGEALGYAHVINFSTGTATLTDDRGHFSIPVQNIGDTVIITYVGYISDTIQVMQSERNVLIELNPKIEVLSEVVVEAKRSTDFLYDLLFNCGKNTCSKSAKSKGYFQLKSYIDSAQIELIESFYNLEILGCDISSAEMKAGRAGLKTMNNRLFTSLESSKPISNFRTTSHNRFMPVTPFQLRKRKLKKSYQLSTEKVYIENGDSILVVIFEPDSPEDKGGFFSGKVWLNKSKNSILQFELRRDSVKMHPFVPVFEEDQIEAVHLHVTKSTYYDDSLSCGFFDRVFFDYTIVYKNADSDEVYEVKTNAILNAFDYHSEYQIPKLDFNEAVTDYERIMAIPYNHFFWEHNVYGKTPDYDKRNIGFLKHDADYSSLPGTLSLPVFIGGKPVAHPIEEWSESRVLFKNLNPKNSKSSEDYTDRDFIQDEYFLDVSVIIDVNTYDDSTDVMTSTILNQNNSYYYLDLNREAQCFINMYFDLIEIERRELESKLNSSVFNPEELKVILENFYISLESAKKQYLDDLERGQSRSYLLKYNQLIKNELGIDNIQIFNPHEMH